MDNPNYQNSAFSEFSAPVQSLPNGTAVLILGIFSIVTCICYGFIGLILGIIALALSVGDVKRYKANPTLYTRSSYNNLVAGRICAIIGIVFGLLIVGVVALIISSIGLDTLQDPDKLKDWLEKMKKEN